MISIKTEGPILTATMLQALLHDAEEHNSSILETTFYEVTIASVDQQKLLSRLSEALVSQISDSTMIADPTDATFSSRYTQYEEKLHISCEL